MTDVVPPLVRSRMMAGIGARNTNPELALRKALHAKGLRYRIGVKDLPGKPDIVFTKFAAVCFVHGCFWHRHAGCKYTSTPSSNVDFWQMKFAANTARDFRVAEELMAGGWRVGVVWECSLRGQSRVERTADEVCRWVRKIC